MENGGKNNGILEETSPNSPFIPHSRCTENSMVDLSKRPGANPQGMPKFWQQKILYRNQKANLSKPHGSTNLLFSKKSPLSGPMYHQIRKRRSVSQEQNTLLKSQNPGNVGFIIHHSSFPLSAFLPISLPLQAQSAKTRLSSPWTSIRRI